MGKQPLKPDDFPVIVKNKKLVTNDGKPVADAESQPIAEDIADRLNEDAARKEEERWAL